MEAGEEVAGDEDFLWRFRNKVKMLKVKSDDLSYVNILHLGLWVCTRVRIRLQCQIYTVPYLFFFTLQLSRSYTLVNEFERKTYFDGSLDNCEFSSAQITDL